MYVYVCMRSCVCVRNRNFRFCPTVTLTGNTLIATDKSIPTKSATFFLFSSSVFHFVCFYKYTNCYNNNNIIITRNRCLYKCGFAVCCCGCLSDSEGVVIGGDYDQPKRLQRWISRSRPDDGFLRCANVALYLNRLL